MWGLRALSLHAGKNPLTAFSASKTKELINDLLGEESINALNRVRTRALSSFDSNIMISDQTALI